MEKSERKAFDKICEAFKSFTKTEKIRVIFNVVAIILMIITSYGMYKASLDGTEIRSNIVGAIIYFIIVSATIIETNYLGVNNRVFKILFIGIAGLKMVLSIVNGASLKDSFDSNSVEILIAILIIIKTAWISMRKKKEVLFHKTDTFVKLMLAIMFMSCIMIETSQGFTDYNYSLKQRLLLSCYTLLPMLICVAALFASDVFYISNWIYSIILLYVNYLYINSAGINYKSVSLLIYTLMILISSIIGYKRAKEINKEELKEK